VLVHVGFALNVVDEAEAQKIFEHLKEMSVLEELGENPA
jgi:hydrogenase expression/formation protein HypC